MNVCWSTEAEQDRAAIWDYIVAHDRQAAVRIDTLIRDCAAKLADFPMLGHPGDVPGTREFTPHRSYRLIYEIAEEAVWIVAVIHTARQWPPLEQ